jgi:environmental stress-induced protein Ves
VSGAVVLLPASERVAVPWKNGGGVTREVAAHPPGRGFDQLDWRVSIAQITVAGAFSAFPGLDRDLAVLEGRLSLALGPAPPRELSPASPPLHFAGDALVHAHPIDGAVTDLNVMTRRGRFRSTLSVREVRAPLALAAPAPTTLVLALSPLTVRSAGSEWHLGRLDAVRCDGDAALGIAPREAAARCYVIELRALHA